MEFTCSPACKVKKRVEVLLQKFEGICFQIPPFVVIRETRGSNRGARGDGSQFGDFSSCQRPVDRPEIVVLVFAHSESPAPVAVRRDPLCTAGRWRWQRQIKDSDPLPGFVAAANRYNRAITCHVHLLHNNVNTEDICGKRQGEMILHHREETDSLLLLGIRIHAACSISFSSFALLNDGRLGSGSRFSLRTSMWTTTVLVFWCVISLHSHQKRSIAGRRRVCGRGANSIADCAVAF